MTEQQPIQIETTAPIPVADLKRKFTENVEFIIDVDNSRLKGRALITYLANLNIDCRLRVVDAVIATDLLAHYLNSPTLVKIPDLEDLTVRLLLQASKRSSTFSDEMDAFIHEHKDIVDVWLKRLYSLPLYAMYCREEWKGYVETFPEDTNDSLAGINFVRLIEHELFPFLLEGVEEDQYTWNRIFFNEYVFAGDNLFSYFKSKNNPYFIGLLAFVMPEEFKEHLIVMDKAVQESNTFLEGISHVPPAQ